MLLKVLLHEVLLHKVLAAQFLKSNNTTNNRISSTGDNRPLGNNYSPVNAPQNPLDFRGLLN